MKQVDGAACYFSDNATTSNAAELASLLALLHALPRIVGRNSVTNIIIYGDSELTIRFL